MASPPGATSRPYASQSEKNGVVAIALAGVVSLVAIFTALSIARPRVKTFAHTNMVPYFLSLLAANFVQSVGAIMNFRWVRESRVVAGNFCTAQGGIKQAGNIGTALWSFVISIHLFNLLFLRFPTTRFVLVFTLIFGWSWVIAMVLLGPAVIEKPELGPYFGISGYWCWITSEYPAAQTFLEYFFEFMSAGLSFILYCAVLLRVRGNIIFADGHWHLQWAQAGRSWQLAAARDMLDSAMIKVARSVVWYPVAYSIILVPIALARLSSFAGNTVPFWATVVTDVIFNLTGLVNVLLFLGTQRHFPRDADLPEYTTPRHEVLLKQVVFVTPFTLTHPSGMPSPGAAPSAPTLARRASADSTSSTARLRSEV